MQMLDKSCYAYPQKRMYPIHTKQAALQSYEDFKHDIQSYSQDRVQLISQNLVKAAKLHDIVFNQQFEIPRESVKIDLQDGKTVSITKVASQQDVSKLLQHLQNNADKLSYGDIQKIAQAMFPYCDQLDLQSKDMQKLASLAGYGAGDAADMADQLLKRANLTDMPENKQRAVFKLYRQVENADDDQLFKMAGYVCQVMKAIDDTYQLKHHYGNKLKDPYTACYGQTMDNLIKQAEDYLSVPSTGTILSKQAMLESKGQIKKFLKDYYDIQCKDDQEMFTKVASLSQLGLKTMLKQVE